MKVRKTYFIVSSLFLLLAVGSLWAGDIKPFSHKYHLTEVEADCADCHNQGTHKCRVQISVESCKACHDDTADIYPPNMPKRSKEKSIRCSHKLHAESFECIDCHANIKEDKIDISKPILDKSRCDACHLESDVTIKENNCAKCHVSDYRKHVPADHKSAWMKRHGKASKWRQFKDHGKDCQVCHKSGECMNCHKEKRPQNHTGLWRMIGHGKAAGWDRSSCKTCHETGTCIRCHKSTRPKNHLGNWKFIHSRLSISDNCKVCHKSNKVNTCNSCHK